MEIKRASELVICELLGETLTDLTFLPHKGGGYDLTPVWQASINYHSGDLIRPTNTSLIHAIVVEVAGNSGSSEPAWTDVPGSLITGPPNYRTLTQTPILKISDSGSPFPPYASVQIEDGAKMLAQEETSFLKGILRWVTRADSSDAVTHSRNFKRIYDTLAAIGSGYDYMSRLIVHGVDITSTADYVDEARQAHGDVINFTMGVTEKPSYP